MKKISILSGGAAQGLVGQLKDRFSAEHGFAIEGSFGAVGLMRERLLAGDPCDVMVLTGEQ
ncbi:MAG: substrate-binding domain-containing protein, partial [Ramlibacter sp.]